MDRINTFAINLVKRTDRKARLVSEFVGRDEFRLTVINTRTHRIGALGLWQSICHIVQQAYEDEMDYVLICEDDHIFTEHYSRNKLLIAIDEAIDKQADILLGGVSWLTTCLPVSENLCWVERFSGLQFTIIFKKIYTKILGTQFHVGDAADYKLSSLSDRIYFMYPFISIQKDFGYSDVTTKNNAKDRVEGLFLNAASRVSTTKRVLSFYKYKIGQKESSGETQMDVNSISIPTYIIKSEVKRIPKLPSDIDLQFEGKMEFDVHIVEPLYTNENMTDEYWLSFRKVIQQAIANNDDVIIICDDDHSFTEAYSKENLIRHIIAASKLGARILCGGIDGVETAVPVTKDQFWINAILSSPFMVLYRTVFDKILQFPFAKQYARDEFYRDITSNKMVVFPFISKRKKDNADVNMINRSSENTEVRLSKICEVAELSGLI